MQLKLCFVLYKHLRNIYPGAVKKNCLGAGNNKFLHMTVLLEYFDCVYVYDINVTFTQKLRGAPAPHLPLLVMSTHNWSAFSVGSV